MSDITHYRGRLNDPQRAATYAGRFERGSRRRIHRREQRAVERILARLTDCKSTLDVPCGAGRFLPSLARGRKVIEMDVSEEVLELARQRAAAQGVTAEFLHGDASRIPLPDAAVDAVFCNRLLHHIRSVAERSAFLKEFHRVARKYVVVSFFDYLAFGRVRLFFKRLKGRQVDYSGQPTLQQFREEVLQCGFGILGLVATGAFWTSQKYFVLSRTPEEGHMTSTGFGDSPHVA
ncbi:MAG: class I SAM-dependent methyltransferase [Verrucomicrobiia bacterium]